MSDTVAYLRAFFYHMEDTHVKLSRDEVRELLVYINQLEDEIECLGNESSE